MATLVTQAMTLNVRLFTCSPINSRRLMSRIIKISTMGSQTPLATCDRTRIRQSGALGIKIKPPPTTIRIV